ncbi:FUSC family protein [Pistricoccus aurantiacus]|nr:FUSC family protein [Pistricoccus aurantiacus]
MMLPRLRDPYFNYRYRHQLHVLRVTVAISLTYTLLLIFNFPHAVWALLSALVVMNNLPYVGGVLDKGGQRLLGTLLGALWGILITLIPGTPHLVVAGWALLGIALATGITFTTRYVYSGLMFCVSLLVVVGDGQQDLSIALWRFFNVMLGTSVGIAVTALLLPQKATDVLRFLLAENLDTLARLYHTHTSASTSADIDTKQLVGEIGSRLIKQQGLMDSIERERRLRHEELEQILSLQWRMLSTVELLLNTLWNTRAGYERIKSLKGFRDQQHHLARALGTLAFQVRTGQNIDITVEPFDLQRHADAITSANTEEGRMLFSPGGYLWLNRELYRLSLELISQLGGIRRLPSRRLRRRAKRHKLIASQPVEYHNKSKGFDP